MKIFCLGDLHYGRNNNNLDRLKDFNQYIEDVFIPDVKKEYKSGDMILQLGDVFDSRQNLNVIIVDSVLKIFRKLVDEFKDVRIVMGNHDMYYKKSNSISALSLLETIGVKIYKEPKYEIINNKSILFIPFTNEKKDFVESITNNPISNYIFCHADISGQMNEADVKSGFERKGIDIIDPRVFNKTTKIISGHIHTRNHYKNIYYVGTPYQLTFADFNNKRGFYILDLETDEIKFIENKVSPKFIRIEIDDNLETSLGDIKDICKSNFIEFIFRNSENKLMYNNIDLVNQFIGAKTVSISIKPLKGIINEENSDSEDLNTDIDLTLSTTDYINHYIKDNFDTNMQNKLLRFISDIESEM